MALSGAELERRDPDFTTDIEASEVARYAMGILLNMRGFLVVLPPTTVRKNADDRHKHRDKGDLWLKHPTSDTIVRVEVKHRKPDSRHVLVDKCVKFDGYMRAKRPVKWVFVVTKRFRQYHTIETADRDYMWPETQTTPRFGREEDVYAIAHERAPITVIEPDFGAMLYAWYKRLGGKG